MNKTTSPVILHDRILQVSARIIEHSGNDAPIRRDAMEIIFLIACNERYDLSEKADAASLLFLRTYFPTDHCVWLHINITE